MTHARMKSNINDLFLQIPIGKADGGTDVKVICDERRENKNIIKQTLFISVGD